MIGLDTNVLVRYLMQDDAAQARLASTVIESAAGRGERLRLTSVTVCELVWVLERTLALEERQRWLFEAVMAGETVLAGDLPAPQERERLAPTLRRDAL